MNERRNVPEIVIATHELLRRSQTRINLLFTMSEIPHASPAGRNVRSDVRGRYLWFGSQPVFALSSLRRARFDHHGPLRHA